MGLEIRFIKTKNPQENKQFRRVVNLLIPFFEKQGWDGLFIGNPESENFQYFRADAILLYPYGLLVLDFKNFSGQIPLPADNASFREAPWYIDTPEDKERIIVKAGSYHKNPFRQLERYRNEMKSIIQTDITLRKKLNFKVIGALNLFSGPIELEGLVHGKYPFYHIEDERNLLGFLKNIYTSDNTYSVEVANALKKQFPTPIWDSYIEDEVEEVEQDDNSSKVVKVDGGELEHIHAFLEKEGSGILVLESMDHTTRDAWMHYILMNASKFKVPQIETWVHSSRIRRRVKQRSGLDPYSLYTVIYGGKESSGDQEEDETEIEVADDIENIKELMDVVGLRSDNNIDDKALILLQDAHFIGSSLHQSDFLRFGTGRLLNDLLQFLDLEGTSRKLICMGDPYSLTFGKSTEIAISVPHLETLFNGDLYHYRVPLRTIPKNEVDHQRLQLANAIEKNQYNRLRYHWSANLEKIDIEELLPIYEKWFHHTPNTVLGNTVLFYKRQDAYRANLHIKNKVINNGEYLSSGDILLLNNNVWVPDVNGFEKATRLYNGMYVLVLDAQEVESKLITRKNATAVTLSFIKIRVKCLSLESKLETDVWVFKNYLENAGELTRDEQIAFRIYLNQCIAEFKKQHPFKSSNTYKKLLQDSRFLEINISIKELEQQLQQGERVKGKLDKSKITLRKIEKEYLKKYSEGIRDYIVKRNPFLNAIEATYGWCITVHKAVGMNFEDVIIHPDHGENKGVLNEDYFRWVYSGISSAKNQIYVHNPVEINPFMDCLFDDKSEVSWTNTSQQTKMAIVLDSYSIPDNIGKFLEEVQHDNCKAVIGKYSEFWELHGFVLQKVKSSGDYLTKAHYLMPDTQQPFVMLFNNNLKGEVSSIRPEKSGLGIDEQIAAAIACLSPVEEVIEEELSLEALEDDFRKEIYRELFEKCQNNDWNLNWVGAYDYQDRFTLSTEKGKIQFGLFYNGKGMFSHIKVLKKTELDMGIVLHEFLLDGN
ncbi:NERD domain-containing protein [Aurantibacter crassamenti]|uniref:NERD domain-containing protein n=1 Tax=Aurantibacter crassamenti TaxID=1837375 RepID=UPI00193AAD3E|nr:NERD domain-containing protein [Aurantibacter crassamenti]MBM1105170.1 NERD domain-containing protein [Aurantibacter crassamenti]